jgi:hypothetical protein
MPDVRVPRTAGAADAYYDTRTSDLRPSTPPTSPGQERILAQIERRIAEIAKNLYGVNAAFEDTLIRAEITTNPVPKCEGPSYSDGALGRIFCALDGMEAHTFETRRLVDSLQQLA